MKRLTAKHFKDSDGYYMRCSGTCSDGCCDGCGQGDEFVDRMGQIEDILGEDYDLDRLRELVEADKKGRCAVLPCKNGDRVWYITPWSEVCEARVTGIWLNIYTSPQMWMDITYYSKVTGQGKFKSRIDLILDKIVFLTLEAAEAALKGEQHECD